jgi:hypothetical protein
MAGAAVILPLFGFSHAVADTITISDDVTLTDPLQVGRLIRNGVASVAGTLKPFPGIADFSPHHYDAYTFVNTTGSLQTVAVTLEMTVYPFRYYPSNGGLASYGPDQIDQYKRAAGYVDRILKGEEPGDLPVQAPTKYMLTINLKTAKTLGLDVPPTLLARSDEVIE